MNVPGLIKDMNFKPGSIINPKRGMKKKFCTRSHHGDAGQQDIRRLIKKPEGTDKMNHT